MNLGCGPLGHVLGKVKFDGQFMVHVEIFAVHISASAESVENDDVWTIGVWHGLASRSNVVDEDGCSFQKA